MEGALQRLVIEPGDPARYALELLAAGSAPEASAPQLLDLNHFLNSYLKLEFTGKIICQACGSATRRSYADGHCYRCFRTLARCDLCVVSPVRCHYAEGTCREPAWGEAYCMQPHVVYLANSSGAKVGITREGGERGRWLDQGAAAGLVIARAASRHLAGVLEHRLTAHVPDRTDWRALVTGAAPDLDLATLRDRLRASAEPLPDGVTWVDSAPLVTLRYPVLAYPVRAVRLSLTAGVPTTGRLLGLKGQYLLFEQGVLNVRRHRGYVVRAAAADAADEGVEQSQMELFRP